MDNVDFGLRAGEVHCLVGENGAGKSTLMKVLSGAESPDAGTIALEGRPVEIRSPLHAQQLGISMIYQEFNLCPYLSVAENVFLGRALQRRASPLIAWGRQRDAARALFERLGAKVDVEKPVHACSVAEQQLVEIAKALTFEAKVLVMDEPSATLTLSELEGLFALVRRLKDQGLGIVYISHRLDEVFEIGDRVTVLRDGKTVSVNPTEGLNRAAIIRDMVGRSIDEEFPKERFTTGETRLRVEGLSREGVFEDVSFSLRTGEIVGLTGLVGAGRTEVARCLFGADRPTAGRVTLDGNELVIRSPRDAIASGIGLLTEDRKLQGLVLPMTIRENTTLANLDAIPGTWLVRRAEESRITFDLMRDLAVRAPGPDTPAWTLSGGNQQKVVLAKWLFTQCSVLIFDEPTRGIDVAAKVAIYHLMNRLVERGVCVLMISSELPEVLGMCDRILVMHEGRIAGELARDEADQARIMRLATGESTSGVRA